MKKKYGLIQKVYMPLTQKYVICTKALISQRRHSKMYGHAGPDSWFKNDIPLPLETENNLTNKKL